MARRTSEARIGGLCTARAEGRRGGRIDPPASIARFPPRMLLLTHRKPGAAETTTNFLIGIWSRYVLGLRGQPLARPCINHPFYWCRAPTDFGVTCCLLRRQAKAQCTRTDECSIAVTCRQKGVCKVPLPYTSSFRSTSKRDYAFRPPVCTKT